MENRLKIWVIAAKFPSTIQPWLANIISQIRIHESEVTVFSTKKGDEAYAEVVDKYDLISRTKYIELTGTKAISTILGNFLSPQLLVSSFRGFFSSSKVDSKYKGAAKNFMARLALAPYLVKQPVDVIHSHSEPAGHKLLPIVKAQGVPFVVTFHGLPPPGVNQLPDDMRQEYIQAASVILVNTEFAKKQYVSLGANPEKIQILPQGTDTEIFKYVQKPFPKDGCINVLTVGRYSEDKGQEFTIRAVAKLISKGYKINFTLIGEGPDKSRLLLLVRGLGIEQYVQFKSSLSEDELILQYQSAHLFVLSSLRARDGFHEETQGVVLQEAQACGAIVVATKSGGIPECVEDGRSAFLVEDRNSDAIVEKLSWMIENHDQWPKWQRRARIHVEENYDINVLGEKMMSLYNQLGH